MFNQLFLDISTGTIDWSRAQFALTAMYHWLFVPLTLGLAVIMGVAETCYYRTKKQFWKDVAHFWQKLFGVNFAMGVATGIILEFQFGTNWSNYSWFVGDIFGAPLAIEGIVALFPPCINMAHRYRRNHFGLVDIGGQCLDAISRGLRVQSRHHAQRDGKFRRCGLVALCH